MKPNLQLLQSQMKDLMTNINQSMEVSSIKINNPRIGYKDEKNMISIKELNDFVIERFDFGLVGDDLNCKALLNAIGDIQNHFHILQDRLKDHWRKTAESIQLLKQYIEQLENKTDELGEYKVEIDNVRKDYVKIKKDEERIKKKKSSLRNIVSYYNKEFDEMIDGIKEEKDLEKIKEDLKLLQRKVNRRMKLGARKIDKKEEVEEEPAKEKSNVNPVKAF